MNKSSVINQKPNLIPSQKAYTGMEEDFRGLEVYDRDHHCIGIINEIYCSIDDLRAKYVEIIPFAGNSEKSYFYPFDLVHWRGSGPVFLNSTWESIQNFIEYDADYVMATSDGELMSYDEALDMSLSANYPEEDWRYCA